MRFPKRLALTLAAVLTALVAAEGVWADSFLCAPTGVAVFPSRRVHVRCATGAPPSSSIFFFALSSKKKEAPLMLDLFTSAKAQGKNILVQYDPNDLSGQKIGCVTTDCRLLIGAEIQP